MSGLSEARLMGLRCRVEALDLGMKVLDLRFRV